MKTNHSFGAKIAVRPLYACSVRTSTGFEFTYHSSAVEENGWEPYDQPDPAAYLPRKRSELVAMPCSGGGGTLLVFCRDGENSAEEKQAFLELVEIALRLAGVPGAPLDAIKGLVEIAQAHAARASRGKDPSGPPAPSSQHPPRRS